MNGNRRHAAARSALARDLELDGSLVVRTTGPSCVDLVRVDPTGRARLYELKTAVDGTFAHGYRLTDGERGVEAWAAAHGVPYVVARYHVSNAGGVETVRRVA